MPHNWNLWGSYVIILVQCNLFIIFQSIVIPVRYHNKVWNFEITIVNFHWNNRVLCIFCRGKNRNPAFIYSNIEERLTSFNVIEYHVCYEYFISAWTETDRLWFGQEIRSDFQLFTNKNVAKSRVALPGIMAGPVNFINDRTETYVMGTCNKYLQNDNNLLFSRNLHMWTYYWKLVDDILYIPQYCIHLKQGDINDGGESAWTFIKLL